MFTFIHTYTEESWDGLVKHGMFRDGDGLKVMHANQRPEWFLFNQKAAIGKPLEQIINRACLHDLAIIVYIKTANRSIPLCIERFVLFLGDFMQQSPSCLFADSRSGSVVHAKPISDQSTVIHALRAVFFKISAYGSSQFRNICAHNASGR